MLFLAGIQSSRGLTLCWRRIRRRIWGELYQSTISVIQAAGSDEDPPAPRHIHGQLLDSNKEELERWISSYKSKWPKYGLTVICDGWTDPTRRSIINFLTYYDEKIFFHKSINTSDKMHDAAYIFGLIEVIDSVKEQNIMSVITDNGLQYKATSELLIDQWSHIY